KLIGAIQRILVGPGAMAVLLSGLVLAMPYMKQGAVPGWMGLMMIAGIIGALGAVAISVPTAAKLARLEVDARGGLPEAFQALRKRQIFAATIAGTLGLIAMFAVTLGKWSVTRGRGNGEGEMVDARSVPHDKPRVDASKKTKPADRTTVLVVPPAEVPNRVLDPTHGEGDLRRRAVAERLATPHALGNRGFVLGEDLSRTIGSARVRVQPRETEIRPVFCGHGRQGVAPQRLIHLAPGGVGSFAIVHVYNREPERLFE